MTFYIFDGTRSHRKQRPRSSVEVEGLVPKTRVPCTATHCIYIPVSSLHAHGVVLKLSSSRYFPRIHQRLSSALRARRARLTKPKPGPLNPELETLAHQHRRLQTLLGMTTSLGETESPAAGQIQDIPLIKPSREIPTTFKCE